MKPDWKDAPEWATYLAMDDNGAWYWYEKEPAIRQGLWFAGGRFSNAYPSHENWKETLETRPE